MMHRPIRRVAVALHGGGSLGAFTWGVLDRLLQEPDFEIVGISGTNAGAMNAGILADGLRRGGVSEARQALEHYWTDVGRMNGFGERPTIDALVAQLTSEYKINVTYSSADVSSSKQVSDMIAQCADQFGGVDILVNNAGIQFTAPVEEFPDEKWEQILAINRSSAFYGIKAALPHMRHRRWGRIINIASAHGLVASATKSAYVAAKHGLVGLTKVVALETARSSITCNAIYPGWVLTPLVQKQIDNAATRRHIQ